MAPFVIVVALFDCFGTAERGTGACVTGRIAASS